MEAVSRAQSPALCRVKGQERPIALEGMPVERKIRSLGQQVITGPKQSTQPSIVGRTTKE